MAFKNIFGGVYFRVFLCPFYMPMSNKRIRLLLPGRSAAQNLWNRWFSKSHRSDYLISRTYTGQGTCRLRRRCQLQLNRLHVNALIRKIGLATGDGDIGSVLSFRIRIRCYWCFEIWGNHCRNSGRIGCSNAADSFLMQFSTNIA